MVKTQDAEKLQRSLKSIAGGCKIQEGNPCNSCFHSIDLGLSDDINHLLWIVHLCLRGEDDEYTEESVIKANKEFFIELSKKYD